MVTERGLKTPHCKENISRNFIQTHRHGRKLWNGKWTIWSLALILSVFENRNVKRIFGYLREEVQESGENYMMRNFIFCTVHRILRKTEEDNTHGRKEKCIQYFSPKTRWEEQL